MTQRFLSGLVTFAAMIAVAGCSTYGGRLDSQRAVHHPAQAATLTISRDRSWVGLFGTMNVKLDETDFYRLKRGGRYSVPLDPGDYILEYSIGLNECSRMINLKPRQSLHLRLSADCMIDEE